MIKFDGTTFYRSDGMALDVWASRSKAGRWRFRLSNGKLLASGITPSEFVRGFWYTDMEDAS